MLNSVQLDIISHSSLLSKSNLQIAFYNANARPYQILFEKHNAVNICPCYMVDMFIISPQGHERLDNA